MDQVRFFFDGVYSWRARSSLRRLVERTSPDIAHLVNIFFQLSGSVIDALSHAGIPIVFQMNDYQLFCSNAYLYREGRVCMLCSRFQYHYGLRHRCYRGSWPASLMSYLAKRWTIHPRRLSKIASFVVPTRAMGDFLRSLGLGDARIDVVQNPFRFEGLVASERWDEHVVFYGRLIRQKGIYTLLEACRCLPGIPFRIYGNGPEEEGVARFVRDHRLDNVLVDTTLRWGPELQEIVGSARLVVVPSEWLVPAEYVVYEAYALGRAVIAGDLGGNRELVEDGVTGRLFRAGDPGDLARKIRELHGDLPQVQAMGREGRRRMEEGYTSDRYYSRIIGLYEDLRRQSTGR